MTFLRAYFVAATCALMLGAPVSAENLAAPTGEVILTVSGDVASTNQGETAAFDLDMLEGFEVTEFSTETPWTEGVQTFEGVSLKALMDALGVTEGTIKATAINDYAVDIPVADAVVDGPIIAFRRNGEPMSVRDKGPLWVVYPYDLNDAYQTEVVYSRSIWQLDRLDINP